MTRHKRTIAILTCLALGTLIAVVLPQCAKVQVTAYRSVEHERASLPPAVAAVTQIRRQLHDGGARPEQAYAGGEELWVIERPDKPVQTVADQPGYGSLMAVVPNQTEKIPVPLKHTDVKGQISGYIATVDVTQQFHNPYDEKIEAVYVFPLPHDAAVNEFVMTIGERKIRGIIREREEARRIYNEARQQGYVASLLTQERPNIFTQSVANIEPGKQIDVNIRYFHTLAYDDGWYEWVFPMVVGPRFNPPGTTDGVGAVPRGEPGASGQKTEVQYLRPNERSGHDIALRVNVSAGVEIEEVACGTHAVEIERPAPDQAAVTLSAQDAIPNRDFVLRYRIAGDTIKTAVLTHRDPRGGYFTLMVYPPDDLRELPRQPLELIFVLDCSGSMNGDPIAKAKAAVEHTLRQLGPDDTFHIIQFSNSASRFGRTPIAATPDNVKRGLKYVRSLEGEGGTMMIEGIKAALDFPHDEGRLRFVAFLTDGFIGNEAEILGEVHRRLGDSRIFSFGVGSSTNRYLLEHMAKMGQGAVAYVGLDDNAEDVMDRFLQRVRRPAMTDLAIDFGGMDTADVYPERLPDLHVGRPVIVTGRFRGEPNGPITVRGRTAGREQAFSIAAVGGSDSEKHIAIPLVWARQRIAELADRSTWDSTEDWAAGIRQVALEYGLMSDFTSFVAVDSLTRTAGDHGTTVAVPVPVPKGVRYETTVGDPARGG